MSNIKLGLGEALLRPFTPPRPSSGRSQAPIQGQGQWEKVAPAHAANTHWPRKSEESVKSLTDVVKQVPTEPRLQSPSQNETTHEPTDPSVEKLISYVYSLLSVIEVIYSETVCSTSVLQKVKTKLNAAASRHGASTKSTTFFHRSETCNQALNDCRNEIMGALTTLPSTTTDNLVEGTGPTDDPEVHQGASVLQQEATLDNPVLPPEVALVSDQQHVNTPEVDTALVGEPAVKNDPNADKARRKKRLDLTNKALKGVEMI
ncbi:hypothetical protein FRC00_007806 [Tulasnella sp. 408]|nr:hypothetical protein FRC00_007806 [Tulasnella sp. 408]